MMAPSTPRLVRWATRLLAKALSIATHAKRAYQAHFTPRTLSQAFLFVDYAPLGHFALYAQRCSPPSVQQAAFAATKARHSMCCAPLARMHLQPVPQVAWTAPLVHTATPAVPCSLSSVLAASFALKRRLLCPSCAPPDITALPTACSTSCCVQRGITAQAAGWSTRSLVPWGITPHKLANHHPTPAPNAHQVTLVLCAVCLCALV